HGLKSVIGAFGVDIRAQFFEKSFDVGFGEEHDVIHTAKRCNELLAGVFVEHGAARSFQIANAGISIQADNKDVALAARTFKIAGMSDVQRIEAAVGEDNALTLTPMFCESLTQHISLDDFGSSLTHDLGRGSGGLVTDGVEKLLP